MLGGHYQQGNDSTVFRAHLQIDAAGRIHCPEASIDGIAFTDLEISPRIGNSRRYLTFADGGCFETDDNDTVDRWVKEYRHASRGGLLIHHLETTARYVAVSIVVTVIFAYAFVNWGVPWLGKQAANLMPVEVSEQLGRGTLDLLDEHLFEASGLSDARQRQLAELFDALHPADTDFELTLQLREAEFIGANAFALPDGTVVLTDALVTLADDDQQIAAVMLHEIAHVHYRHALRGALQDAGLAALLLVIAGDVSSANSFLVTLPSLLIRTSYSRGMESEADLYALAAMQQHGMDPSALLDMLQKLEQAHHDKDNDNAGNGHWLDYLSTHPVAEERYEPLRKSMEP